MKNKDIIEIYLDYKKPKILITEHLFSDFISENKEIYKINIYFNEIFTDFEIYLNKKTKKYKFLITLIENYKYYKQSNKSSEEYETINIINDKCKEIILKKYIYKFSLYEFRKFIANICNIERENGRKEYKYKLKSIIEDIIK